MHKNFFSLLLSCLFPRSVTAERGKRKKMVLSDSSDEEEQRQPKKTTKSAPAHTLSDDEDFTTQVIQREMGG